MQFPSKKITACSETVTVFVNKIILINTVKFAVE